jgi:hypothetical protein
MKNRSLTLLGLTTALLCVAATHQASANANNLRCNNPFVKVATYNNAIKCKKVQTFNASYQANAYAKLWRRQAGCNAHSSPPKSKVWPKQVRPGVTAWKARVIFTCAIIN